VWCKSFRLVATAIGHAARGVTGCERTGGVNGVNRGSNWPLHDIDITNIV